MLPHPVFAFGEFTPLKRGINTPSKATTLTAG